MSERWNELVIDDDRRGVFRVDRRAYTDAELFALERARIFEACWIYVAHASEIPHAGDFVTRTVAGRSILLTRDQEGSVRAHLNTCTHRGTTLCAHASGNARSFRCPYHAWTFDLRGRLCGVPARDTYGDAFVPTDFDLKGARVEAYRDFLFVTFDPGATSLADYLAGAKEHLDLIVDQSLGAGMEVVPGSQRYDLRANWKLLGENSIDTYHVMSLHRRYLDHLEDQGIRPTRPQVRAYQLGHGHAVSETSPPVSGKPVAFWGPPMPTSHKPAILALSARLEETYGLERARRIGQTHRQLLVFPNLMVIDGCATTIRTWDPIGIDRMSVTAWALAPRGQTADDRALTLQAFLTFFGPGGFATPDDIEILEGCQAGFANTEVRWADYSRGMGDAATSHDSDLPIRAFWRRWRELVTSTGASGVT
jgi:p-cumate 2,3-dioxygenase alpha subunit